MTVNIVEILDLYLKNGGRRPYIIIVLNSCFIPKTFRTFPGFFPIFHRHNKNQDFFRTGNGFYEIPDFFPFSRLRGNPVFNAIMKLHDFLHRTCVIIPLSNSVTVCGAQGPHARCSGYFQHMVLYTIVKYSIQYGLKNL